MLDGTKGYGATRAVINGTRGRCIVGEVRKRAGGRGIRYGEPDAAWLSRESADGGEADELADRAQGCANEVAQLSAGRQSH